MTKNHLIDNNLCREVISEHVTPGFEAKINSGRYGRAEGSLVIMHGPISALHQTKTQSQHEIISVGRPTTAMYHALVLHEHSWGSNAIGSSVIETDSFSAKAFQKAIGCFNHGNRYAEIPNGPKSTAHQDFVDVPGAIIGDISRWIPLETNDPVDIIVSYAGLWWEDDISIAASTLASLEAEVTRRAFDH